MKQFEQADEDWNYVRFCGVAMVTKTASSWAWGRGVSWEKVCKSLLTSAAANSWLEEEASWPGKKQLTCKIKHNSASLHLFFPVS